MNLYTIRSKFQNISLYHLLIVFLLTLYAINLFYYPKEIVLMQLFFPTLGAVIFGSLFDYFEYKNMRFPTSPLISGLILGLVAQFGERAWVLFVIGGLAMLVKFAIKLWGRHIFNPAASGLFLGMIFLGSAPAWWGADYAPWIFIIWIPILLSKLHRFPAIAGFTGVFLTINLLLNGPLVLSLFLSGAYLFFLSVMLIEPMTSPNSSKVGVFYGAVTALFYTVLPYIPGITVADPLVPALLLGNLVGKVVYRFWT